MFLSIIIPVYNKEEGIRSSIMSVFSQQFDDYELIIVDDGSKDHSMEIVNAIANEKTIIIKQENAGPSAARNHGVKVAKGDWVVFLDADDEFEQGAFLTFKRYTENNSKINCFVFNHYLESKGVKRVRSTYYPDGILSNSYRSWFFNMLNLCQGAVLLRREISLRHPYPENIRRWEDAAMMFDVMREEKLFRSHIPVFTYHRDSSIGSARRKSIEGDFFAHLNPKDKSFWEKECLYKMYRNSLELYPKETKQLYGKFLDWRYSFVYSFFSKSISYTVKIKHFLAK